LPLGTTWGAPDIKEEKLDMPTQELYLSQEGLAKLQEELSALKSQRLEITEKIKEAREFGDLSENAEYQEAKMRQSFIEGRIEEIETTLKLAKIIDEKAPRNGDVAVGSTVTVKVGGREAVYHITGSNEADPAAGKISNESPLGRVLLGHHSGEKVTLATGEGEREYHIIKVS
jgi:transcription elongation factor GreA